MSVWHFLRCCNTFAGVFGVLRLLGVGGTVCSLSLSLTHTGSWCALVLRCYIVACGYSWVWSTIQCIRHLLCASNQHVCSMVFWCTFINDEYCILVYVSLLQLNYVVVVSFSTWPTRGVQGRSRVVGWIYCVIIISVVVKLKSAHALCTS